MAAFVLLVAAIICEAAAALLGFGIFTGSHILGWLALGLVFLAAAHLVSGTPVWRRGD